MPLATVVDVPGEETVRMPDVLPDAKVYEVAPDGAVLIVVNAPAPAVVPPMVTPSMDPLVNATAPVAPNVVNLPDAAVVPPMGMLLIAFVAFPPPVIRTAPVAPVPPEIVITSAVPPPNVSAPKMVCAPDGEDTSKLLLADTPGKVYV